MPGGHYPTAFFGDGAFLEPHLLCAAIVKRFVDPPHRQRAMGSSIIQFLLGFYRSYQPQCSWLWAGVRLQTTSAGRTVRRLRVPVPY